MSEAHAIHNRLGTYCSVCLALISLEDWMCGSNRQCGACNAYLGQLISGSVPSSRVRFESCNRCGNIARISAYQEWQLDRSGTVYCSKRCRRIVNARQGSRRRAAKRVQV